MIRQNFLILILSVCILGSAKADYQVGLDAFQSGKYEEAYKEWMPLAQSGDPKAQHGIGLIFEWGKGDAAPDYTEAAKWYMLAAKQDFPPAENNLALLYLNGVGVQSIRARSKRANGPRKSSSLLAPIRGRRE
jgi:uncharacterized protein